MELKTLNELTEALATIKGISKKTAGKITEFLLYQDNDFKDNLIQKILNLKQIGECHNCHFYTEYGICDLCSNKNRSNILVVVENKNSAIKLNSLGAFDAYYYVLPYLVNVKNKLDQNDFEYRDLIKFIKNRNFEEVILVLSPTLDGVLTSNHIEKLCKREKINVTKAAIGMPAGSNIDYLDPFTLKQSIENRKGS